MTPIPITARMRDNVPSLELGVPCDEPLQSIIHGAGIEGLAHLEERRCRGVDSISLIFGAGREQSLQAGLGKLQAALDAAEVEYVIAEPGESSQGETAIGSLRRHNQRRRLAMALAGTLRSIT